MSRGGPSRVHFGCRLAESKICDKFSIHVERREQYGMLEENVAVIKGTTIRSFPSGGESYFGKRSRPKTIMTFYIV